MLCRHTLEHIAPVREFVGLLRRPVLERDGVVVIEVPDVLRVLVELAFWDVYYEHCSYFTGESLEHLAVRSGLEVLANELEFDGQYIVLEARTHRGGEILVEAGERVRLAVGHFEVTAPARSRSGGPGSTSTSGLRSGAAARRRLASSPRRARRQRWPSSTSIRTGRARSCRAAGSACSPRGAAARTRPTSCSR